MKVARYLPLIFAVGALGNFVLAQTIEVEKPVVVSAVAPVYPAVAEAARATGQVTVEVEIDKEGKVTEAKPVATHSFVKLLGKAAEEAARRWRFEPSSKAKRKAQLVFSFRLMDEKTSNLDSTPIFSPPYKIELRKKLSKIEYSHDHFNKESLGSHT